VLGSDVSDDLRIHDSEAVRNHIKTVSMAKKQFVPITVCVSVSV
jgi:hypothetical protein